MKLLAFIVPGLVSMSAAQPQTFVSFSADSKRTLSVSGIEIGNIGKIKVDNQLKRIRTDISEISIEVGGFAGSGVSLDPTVMKLSGTELLRYDMKKNFSWATDPQSGTVVCACVDLESPMPQFAVDAQAVAAGQDTIESPPIGNNKVSVVTDKWTSGLTMQSGGAGVSNTLTYNVQAPKKLLRMEMKASVSGGGGMPGMPSLESSFAFDFWNVKELTESESKSNWYDPHPSCVCPSAPVLPIANSYPTVIPTTPCNAFGGCACLRLNSGIPDDLAFCKNEVKWQISETLFPAQTDAFVEQAYDSWVSVFNPSDECKPAYKTWLCKFYFQICAEGGALLIPPAFGACAGVTFSTAETTGYQQVANLAAGKTAGGKTTSSASTTSAISLALALPVAVTLL